MFWPEDIMKGFFAILFCLFASIGWATYITPQEQDVFNNMLHRIGLNSDAPDFLKDWDGGTELKHPLIIDVLNHPFKLPRLAEDMGSILEKADPGEFQRYSGLLLGQIKPDNNDVEMQVLWNKTVHKRNDVFSYVNIVYTKVQSARDSAFAQLTAQERDRLSYFSYHAWSENEDLWDYDNDESYTQQVAQDSLNIARDIAPFIKKIDFGCLFRAAEILRSGMDILAQNYHYDAPKSILRHKSVWGEMLIGTAGDDSYTGNPVFILDQGGNDRYRCPLSTSLAIPALAVVDLAGDDAYLSPEGAFGPLEARFGCLYLRDNTGNDLYQGRDGMLSAWYGTLNFVDAQGDDTYRAGLHTLGAATFGYAGLFDLAGNDVYTCTQLGEGFAGPWAVGVLADEDGHDVYFAGGRYFHAPLCPLDFKALSQGCSFGMRSDLGGGFGVLYDRRGTDHYNGGVFSQGIGYWYAVGLLIDQQGNDSYDAVYYPQGSGIHLAAGLLYDGTGDDHYYTKNGPGQGAGHDYGVGFLIDRSGNDAYSIPGGNGLGLTNSVGVFLDASGDDRYERRNQQDYGFANSARDSGGIGLFLDAGGKDTYPDSLWSDDRFWSRGTFAAGLDTLMVNMPAAYSDLEEEGVAQLDDDAPIEDIFAAAGEWEVGSAATRVTKARQMLLNHEEKAVDYIIRKKMHTDSGLEFRALEFMAQKSSLFRARFAGLLSGTDSLAAKQTIALIASVGDSTFIDSLLSLARQRRYVPSVISALGAFKDKRSIPVIAPYLTNTDERWRFIAARSIKGIGGAEAVALLKQRRDDPSFLIQALVRMLK